MRKMFLAGCVLLLGVAAGRCASASAPASVLSPTRLRYRLLDRYSLFYCDPDFYPVARGDEPQLALERFPEIAADREKFGAILEHLGLSGIDFSAEQKLQIYREFKRLAAIGFDPAGAEHAFELRSRENGAVFLITGTIDATGRITEQSRTPTAATCPICLSADTRIAIAGGEVPVSELHEGTSVWSLDGSGRRVLAPVLRVASVPMPAGHKFLHLRLGDGRELFASAGHPLPDGRRLGDLAPGDPVDGSPVVLVEHVAAHGAETWDLLPDTPSGVYFANGIVLGSTLAVPSCGATSARPSTRCAPASRDLLER